MWIQDAGRPGFERAPFIGGPLHGKELMVRGGMRPERIRVTTRYTADRQLRQRPGWESFETGVPIETVFYEWSETTCAYVVASEEAAGETA